MACGATGDVPGGSSFCASAPTAGAAADGDEMLPQLPREAGRGAAAAGACGAADDFLTH
eukprot:gene12007-40532_t